MRVTHGVRFGAMKSITCPGRCSAPRQRSNRTPSSIFTACHVLPAHLSCILPKESTWSCGVASDCRLSESWYILAVLESQRPTQGQEAIFPQSGAFRRLVAVLRGLRNGGKAF